MVVPLSWCQKWREIVRESGEDYELIISSFDKYCMQSEMDFNIRLKELKEATAEEIRGWENEHTKIQ